MVPSDDDKPDPERLFPRREFLRISGAALLALPACGDDTIAGTDGASSSSGGDGSSSSSGEPTSGDLPTTSGSTGDTTTGAIDDGTTTTTSDDGTTTGDTTEGATTEGATTDEPADCDAPELAFDPDAIAQDFDRFPTAVLAGSMRQTSALLHTTTSERGPVLLRVWQPGDAPGVVRLAYELEVTPDGAGYLREVVTGLCPGQWYRYGFFALGGGEPVARGLLGEFRTALADGALEPITVALSSCNGFDNRPWPALLTTADEYYDAFIHVGDMAYNDSAVTQGEYRDSWRSYLAVEQDGQVGGMAVAFSRAGLYCTLDDHEVTNNFNPETIGAEQLATALDAYFEAVPVTDEPDGFRVWRSYVWGATVEFIVLDCRTERKPSTLDSDDPIYISKPQMEWLKQRLLDSPCHFKVVLNSVPITDMPTVPWDLVYQEDRWEGYAAQREELLGFIESEEIRNVWFLSGDFHVCFVSQVEPGGGGVLAKTREIAVTGGNTNPLGEFLDPPQFDYGSAAARAVLLTFDPQADEVLVRFLDPSTGQDVYNKVLSQK